MQQDHIGKICRAILIDIAGNRLYWLQNDIGNFADLHSLGNAGGRGDCDGIDAAGVLGIGGDGVAFLRGVFNLLGVVIPLLG